MINFITLTEMKNKKKTDNDNKHHHKHITTKKIQIAPIDSFYETDYTANTCTKITQLYKTLKLQCKQCRISHVDLKMVIKDTYNPTFVILRKLYCLSCWCKKMGVGN